MSANQEVPREYVPDVQFDPRFPSKVINTDTRSKLEQQVAEFLAAGGVIQIIPEGVSGIDDEEMKRSFRIKAQSVGLDARRESKKRARERTPFNRDPAGEL